MSEAEVRAPRGRGLRWLPWLITALCFGYLYTRLGAAAARENLSLASYFVQAFAQVNWIQWLALMIPYSCFYFLVDSLVVWRVINWFNTRVSLGEILPIRGSSYILSILNEQVGKGAMGFYLNRRHGVPGWEVGSSLLFIMFCEFYYLLSWATLGYLSSSADLPAEFRWIPRIAAAAWVFFAIFCLYARGSLWSSNRFRDRPVFRAFRQASPWHYLGVIVLRSPALLAAVVIYTWALALFGVDTTVAEMLGTLPVIFFGAATPGPMRSVAITLWVVLFPGNEAQMAAFGFVQHNFFIFFNAAIGLLFLRRAQRELFGSGGQAQDERET